MPGVCSFWVPHVHLTCSVTKEVRKPARYKTVKIHQNEHTLGGGVRLLLGQFFLTSPSWPVLSDITENITFHRPMYGVGKMG